MFVLERLVEDVLSAETPSRQKTRSDRPTQIERERRKVLLTCVVDQPPASQPATHGSSWMSILWSCL